MNANACSAILILLVGPAVVAGQDPGERAPRVNLEIGMFGGVGSGPIDATAWGVDLVVPLLLLRSWGFLAVYVLAPFSTIFHGIALVPWITSALPTLEMRIWAVGVLNALFLVAAAVAHWSSRDAAPIGERRFA